MRGELLDKIQSQDLRAIFQFWRSKCQGDKVPSRADIDPVELGRLLSKVFLIDVMDTSPKYRVRLMMSEFEEQYGEPVTGRYVEDLDLGSDKEAILRGYDQLVATREPFHMSSTYKKEDGRRMRFERIAMPLSTSGKRVDMVLGGMESMRLRTTASSQAIYAARSKAGTLELSD